MFTEHLRELERAALLTRTVHAVVPPQVEYAIARLGLSAVPVIERLRDWGPDYRRKAG